MRMRKLAWAEDFLQQEEVVMKNPSDYKGKWKNILNRDVLHVEIGSGKGDYWVQMAKLYPTLGWIGIERNRNVAALAVKKQVDASWEKDNMRFISEDAQCMHTWFAQGEIDVIHLNFSDPWPKKRTHKKRLSNRTFIAQYANVLAEDGEIQMKTDNMDLFEYSILEFQKAGWFLHEFSTNFRRVAHDEDVISEYERRFMNLGQPIYRAVWKKHQLMDKELGIDQINS